MNPTIVKFGYPATLLAAYDHWVVLLRPAQVTLGSLVLAHAAGATRMAAVPAAAFAELATVTGALERALADALSFDKINYLCLMMVDREVHFHVFPRYAEARAVGGRTYPDRFWPKAPDVTAPPLELDPAAFAALYADLKRRWPAR
jgi:diadenosine tetraphosphate (Ap4A) HIT family hydrolase